MGKTFLTYSIKQLLGLGGKNAAVVFDDADLDKCVKVLIYYIKWGTTFWTHSIRTRSKGVKLLRQRKRDKKKKRKQI